MTPLHLEILIHYHTSDTDFERIDYPACETAALDLTRWGLLDFDEGDNLFVPTRDTGNAVRQMCQIVGQWVGEAGFKPGGLFRTQNNIAEVIELATKLSRGIRAQQVVKDGPCIEIEMPVA